MWGLGPRRDDQAILLFFLQRSVELKAESGLQIQFEKMLAIHCIFFSLLLSSY